MKNQMIVYNEDSIFTKIKKYLYNLKRKIFKIKDVNTDNATIEKNSLNEELEFVTDKKDPEFINEIKITSDISNAVIREKEFFEQINGNAEMLEKLSIDRLRKLEQYYDNIIKNNELKLKKLKSDT